MRLPSLFALVFAAGMAAVPARADRPDEKRESADLVFVGKVRVVYIRDDEGYKFYIVELSVEEVEKGAGIKKGDIFRAYCYQLKPGKGGLQFDTNGHNAVPKEGQRIKAFVNKGRGQNEGVYPDWFDALPTVKKLPPRSATTVPGA